MTQKVNTIAMVALSIAMNCSLTQGQSPPSTTLVIDLQNVVEYQDDAGNPAKFATDPNRAPSATFINFGVGTVIADIVAVNGKPAKGIYAGRSRGILASATPRAGGAIADLTRTSLREQVFEILTGDGIPIGTIMSVGFGGGQAPPGARRFGAEGTDFIGAHLIPVNVPLVLETPTALQNLKAEMELAREALPICVAVRFVPRHFGGYVLAAILFI